MLKTFVEETLCAVFQKISKSEKVYGSEAGRRVSSFFVENFLSHSAENFRKGTLLSCAYRKFPVAKKFLDQRGGGEYQVFPWKIFCLTVSKDFVGGGGGVSRSSVENSLYHCRKFP